MTTATRKPNKTAKATKITSKKSAKTAPAVAKLRQHVTGKIAAGKAEAIVEIPVKTPKIMPLCWCGCGNHTRGGKWQPGHDARAVGLARRAARGEEGLVIDDLADALPHQEARDHFAHHVEQERKRIAAATKSGKPVKKSKQKDAPGTILGLPIR